ncbi:altered inheritance rate of mitochondria protein 25 [Malania oleifera]|uniref:altered inheritance rate of mitochondria protein 25 n=1 Tax=Malania oleifera TaxID=397392 RepID=UPI0025AEB175|nr:altered inheritance rate of mitochondria protein 25 [Malania oleifera]
MRSFFRIAKSHGVGISKWYGLGNKHHIGFLDADKLRSFYSLQSQIESLPATLLRQSLVGAAAMSAKERSVSARNSKHSAMVLSRQFGQSGRDDIDKGTLLNRDFLVQLWDADRKARSFRAKRKRKVDKQPLFQHPFGRWFSGASIAKEKSRGRKQPPPSEPVTGFLKPESPEEVRIAPLLARSNLVITRDIEWANLALGFEQENRYAIVDVCYPQSPVGYIREQSNLIARQLLRSRRPFVAYIIDALGNELFRIRRPFWWITSSIYAEVDGREVGVVHRRWHLWRRIYDLYLGDKQFAVVENPGLWNWTFTLKDIDGKVLAEIDRNWRGFGFELFTDAGQYAIRFGSADPSSKTGPALIEELEVLRPLTLSERAVALALAVSLDNDYFSRHGGWGIPFIAVEE